MFEGTRMDMHTPRDAVSARDLAASLNWLRYLPAFLFLIVSLALVALRRDVYVMPRLEDDAYYYLVVARHLFENGVSEFTPGIPTNGYHPLWLGVIFVIGSLFGFSVLTLKVTEIVVAFIGFVGFIKLFRIQRFTDALLYTFLLWYILRSFALNGMETSLLFPALVLLVGSYISTASVVAQNRGALIFIASAMVIGTRLDSAMFALPMLAIAPIAARSKIKILAGLGLAGLCYAAVNQYYFGSTMPISGAVKSLGGVQINAAYLKSLAALQLKTPIALTQPVVPYLAMLGALAIAIARSHTQPAKRLTVSLIYAAAIGMLFYGAKLAFGSSWVTWPWYNYPTLIFALLTIHLIQQYGERLRIVTVLKAAAGVSLAAAFLYFDARDRQDGFPGLNKVFVEKHSDALNGRVIAMGDRAGSLGFFYRPGVYQLEGLVNSKSYIDVLKTGGDLRQHLCAKGIDVFVSYVMPDQTYQEQDIDILRPFLTGFRGPTLRVKRSEEIASLQDLGIYQDVADEGNTRIAAWRLQCPGR